MVMSVLLKTYYSFAEEIGDPRTKDWLLMRAPLTIVSILTLYVSFCLKWGPKIMEHRKPLELRNTLLVYNAANVAISAWMFYEGLASGWWNDYSYKCQPVDYSDSPKAVRMARLVWIYFICKIVELLDTILFVVRKKNNQVTLLHLYHHTVMPIMSYLVAKFVPGGHLTFGILLNCFVHMLMYGYYLLAALGPNFQKYLWWKSYVTKLQLIQFVAIIIHTLQLFLTDCNFPKALPMFSTANTFLFMYLFWTFHQRTYSKPTSEKIYTEVNKNSLNKEWMKNK